MKIEFDKVSIASKIFSLKKGVLQLNKFRFSIIISLFGLTVLVISTYPKYHFIEWIAWILIGSAITIHFECFFIECKRKSTGKIRKRIKINEEMKHYKNKLDAEKNKKSGEFVYYDPSI